MYITVNKSCIIQITFIHLEIEPSVILVQMINCNIQKKNLENY